MFKETPEGAPDRASLRMEQAPTKNDEYNMKKVRNEMALLPDVTYEDRFMNIGTEQLNEIL